MTRSSTSRRRQHRLLASSVVLLAVALLSIAPVAAAQPALEVDDGSELSGDGVLNARATGLEPGTTVFLLLCNSDESIGGPATRCALLGAGSEGYEVDDDGTVELVDVPLRPGRVGTNAACPPTFEQDQGGIVCEVVIADEDQQTLASGSISYEVPQPRALAETGSGPITAMILVVGVALLAAGATALLAVPRRPSPRPE